MDCDDDNDGEVGSSSVRRISTIVCSKKRPVRPPTDHFKRPLEEVYPNHACSVRHKLKDYIMIRSFMTSRSLTWGTELDEGLDGSDTTPFPEKNTIVMVYRGCPLSGRHHVSNLSSRALTHCGWEHRGLRGVMTQVSLYPYIYILKCILQPFRGTK
jgi:hypothetical protein